MKKLFQFLKYQLLPLLPLGQTLLIAAAAFVLFLIFIGIFFSAEYLGVWFLPVLLLYFAILALPTAYIYRQRELLQIRGLIGDEEFYRQFPRIKQRDENRARRIE